MKRSKSAPPAEVKPFTAEQHRTGLERLVFFSDAVFAIAITILVLDIHLPAGVDLSNERQLLNALAGLWPKYLAYLISFWGIGLYWMNHHRKFLYIKKFDHILLSLNLVFLMTIAFIPFPTSIMSEYANRIATIFYAAVLALAGFLLAILWLYATRNHRLVEPNLTGNLRRREALGPIAISVIFLLSIVVGFYNLLLVRVVWILLIPVSFLLNIRRDNA